MKRIYNALFAITALLVFAPLAHGQYSIDDIINNGTNTNNEIIPLTWQNSNTELHQPEGAGFAYRKIISEPQSDGTYWIKLESFSTGAATFIQTSMPADIVLVLDMSQSMSNNYKSGEIYYPTYYYTENNQHTSYNKGDFTYNNLGNGTWYYKYNGVYRQIQRTNSNNYGSAYFVDNGTTYYLNGDQLSTTRPSRPNNYNANSTVLWTKYLYRYKNGQYARLDALKAAVGDFIDIIYHNDNYEDNGFDKPRSGPLGNRISVVVYSQNDESVSRTIKTWTNVTATDGSADTSIIDAVAYEGYDFYTYSNIGMRNANTLLSQSKTDRRDNCSRTLVMFTDGIPADQNWTNNSTTVANQCIGYANTAKNSYDATVFSVLVYSGTVSDNMNNYLQGISSNYPDAESLTNLGARCDASSRPEAERKEAIYFKNAGDNLSGVFQDIAQMSGGSSTTLTSASRNVDVVSNNFILPDNASSKTVHVFVAKLLSMSGDNYIFDTEIEAGHCPNSTQDPTYAYYYYPRDKDGNIIGELTKVDADIDIARDDSKKSITVTGFDYSSNFCGPVYATGSSTVIDHYQGFKIIIMIPITMNPDAVGGPNAETNGPGSGIYIKAEDQEAFVQFKSPTVSLPVNIHIEKKGLKSGESAKFMIERAILPAGDNVDLTQLEWSYVSTVFVTRAQGSAEKPYPVVKVKGLPATIQAKDSQGNLLFNDDNSPKQVNVVYRVSEEGWSWSYDSTTPAQYTNTQNIDNPFTFENGEKINIDVKVRHAESKATNVFKPNVVTNNVKYDDSKDNGR